MFCLGKLKLKGDCIWYVSNDNETYCEPCFKRYPRKINGIQFNTIYGNGYYCHLNCDEFRSFSVMNSGMRISIVHPQTLYRYSVEPITANSIRVRIPNLAPYAIVIENYDKYADTRINIENIMFGDQTNIFDSCSTKNKLIVPFMSYSSDLLFDESDNNIITFKLNKWIRRNDADCSYYGLYKEVPFTIELVRDDKEYDIMQELTEKYIRTDNKKIVIVEDFI